MIVIAASVFFRVKASNKNMLELVDLKLTYLTNVDFFHHFLDSGIFSACPLNLNHGLLFVRLWLVERWR